MALEQGPDGDGDREDALEQAGPGVAARRGPRVLSRLSYPTLGPRSEQRTPPPKSRYSHSSEMACSRPLSESSSRTTFISWVMACPVGKAKP